MDGINISLSEGIRNGVSHVRVDGVIDTLTAGELEEVIDRLVARSRYRVVIDLAGVDYISSPGWGIFISHIKNVREHDGDIKLCGMLPNVLEIYELLELDNVLRRYRSVDEALDDFDGESPKSSPGQSDGKPTRLTISDRIADDDRVDTSPDREATNEFDEDVEAMVLRFVREDPFASIREMRQRVNATSDRQTSWWRVFGILRNRNLLRKRSRFRIARSR